MALALCGGAGLLADDTEALVGLLTCPGCLGPRGKRRKPVPGEEPNKAGRLHADGPKAARLSRRRVWGRGKDRQTGFLRNSLTNIISTL